MNLRKFLYSFLPLLLAFAFASANAQPGYHVDIKKDRPFQERKLKAEKTGDGPIKAPKRIFTNVTTRFNYYFNANNKLADILDRAKAAHRDDFSELLTFYPYTLEATAADSAQLDSVIFKCRSGIVNHDLRGEWTDELYLLWAQSWHLQKKLDSSSLMLQFINYAYAPQTEYGYYDYIGSRKDNAQELTIVTPEKKKFLHSNTFSRNTAFIWQVRTLTELGDFGSSGSLITTLKRDPAFPKRLNYDLAEVEAYWYYKQQRWDSAATYLIKALDGADNKKEKARWEYLIAQLLERSDRRAEAAKYYTDAIDHTPDPVMEVYGRLNLVRINKEGGDKAIDKNVEELLKMAKRDKYEDYRDIIYYMAAQMEMERSNIAAAQELLMKGAKFNNGNQSSRNRAFLQIADVSFNQKKYVQAASFYDSVQVNDLAEADAQRVFQRKPPLQVIATNIGVISRQDSLQRIAAMPKEQQEDYIKILVKRLRKEQGLKDEAAPTGGNALTTTQPTDLFSASTKGEWYFYNSSSKAQGAAEFKKVWGNRPNVDNWRRFAVVNQQLATRDAANQRDPKNPNATTTNAEDELTEEALSAKLPTTPAAIKISNDSIRTALVSLGAAYLNDLEDYPSAISTFEEIRRRFPTSEPMDEVLFNLYYAHTKAGHAAEAASFKRLLQEKYPSSRYTAILTTGKDPQSTTASSVEATKAYEGVYNQFIEGRFEEAIAAKQRADSTYKTTVWQPQLLYIEAVYYVKQRQDSQAKASLQNIVKQNSNPVLTDKAQNLLRVLGRRQQIEDELNRYQMQNGGDSTAKTVVTTPTPPVRKDTVVKQQTIVKRTDSAANQQTAALKKSADSLAKAIAARNAKDSLARKALAAAAAKDSIAKRAIALKKEKDSIAAARAIALKNAKDSAVKSAAILKATRDSLARTSKAARDSLARVAKAEKDSLAKAAIADRRAKDSLAKAQAITKRVNDSLAKKAAAELAKKAKDSIARAQVLAKAAKDSIAKAQAREKVVRDSLARIAALPKSPFSFAPETPHSAMLILDKVDPVFVNEARNAFFQFIREKYYGQPLDVQLVSLTNDLKVLLVTGFANAQAATDFVLRAKPAARAEIIPWLTPNKYSFSIISAPNFEVLKANTDVAAYKKFLEQYLPGKF